MTPKDSNKGSIPGCNDSPGRWRGKASRSIIRTRRPACEQRIAVAVPAGPAPTMATSNISIGLLGIQNELKVFHVSAKTEAQGFALCDGDLAGVNIIDGLSSPAQVICVLLFVVFEHGEDIQITRSRNPRISPIRPGFPGIHLSCTHQKEFRGAHNMRTYRQLSDTGFEGFHPIDKFI